LIRAHFGSGVSLGLSIRYSKEEQLRGTAGALKLAEGLIGGDAFLAMNGDSFFDVRFEELLALHRSKAARATLALAHSEDRQRFGTVDIDAAGQIQGFIEKGSASQGGWINGGIYVFQRDVLTLIPEGRPVSLEQEIFPSLIGNGFFGCTQDQYFVDIGIPEEYRRIQADPSRLLAAIS
jgi:NDP-sugar pyrophosphorylase family protein